VKYDTASALALAGKFLRMLPPPAQLGAGKTTSKEGFVNCEMTDELFGYTPELPRQLAIWLSGFSPKRK